MTDDQKPDAPDRVRGRWGRAEIVVGVAGIAAALWARSC